MYSSIQIYGLLLLGINIYQVVEAQLQRRTLIGGSDKYASNDDENFDTSRYKFAYGVEDHKTGDFKMHQEERDGDLVKGEYTVADADGTLRTVKYTADKYNGFHAIISKAGDSRQEMIPRPAPLTAQATYNHPVKMLPSPSNHYSFHNREKEGVRYPETAMPIAKFIQALPKMARYHGARFNRVLENYSGDNSAHYQTVNMDNNNEQTHYTLKLSQDAKEKEENVKKDHHLEVYHYPVAFNLQTPHGFRKSEESMIAMPSTMSISKIEHEESNENVSSGGYESSVEEPQWKQHDNQSIHPRMINNYKQAFDSHFGHLRRPQNDHGAFSYMNYEGESNNGYELQHTIPRKKSMMHRR